MIVGNPHCFRCFPPAFVPAFAIRRRRALCSFPFSIFPKAWGTNDLLPQNLNFTRMIPEGFMSFFGISMDNSPPCSDSYLYNTLSHIPGIVLRWPILRPIWYFLLHDASYPFLVLSTTAQQIEIQTPTLWPTITWSARTFCKNMLQGQLAESETPDFHHFCINRNILQHQSFKGHESSTLRALPCQLPLLPFPFPLSHSQPQPQTHSHYSISHCISISTYRLRNQDDQGKFGFEGFQPDSGLLRTV